MMCICLTNSDQYCEECGTNGWACADCNDYDDDEGDYDWGDLA
jgi:hypothetical protein